MGSRSASSWFFGEHLEVNCLEQGGFVEDEGSLISSSLEDNMPFLHMLQSVESSQPFFPFKEPSFHTLLRLQHLKKPWEGITYIPNNQAMDFESCATQHNDMLESESNDLQQTHHSTSCADEKLGRECSHAEQPKSGEDCSKQPQVAATTRERKKRKRTRQTKNKEDVENQRMTHIAVERNRRRQMNDHLSVLKSLMPPSYIQRGDHASIIGGAIDFVKELEQLLQSLEVLKKMRTKNEEVGSNASLDIYGMSTSTSTSSEVKAERKSEAASIEVTVIQTHVNLKIQCQKRPGQLVKVILALEELMLTVLHLNITSSSETSVLYSFNLKIEEDSKLGSANEIAAAVEHILSFING